MTPSNSVPISGRKPTPLLSAVKQPGRRRPPTRLVSGGTGYDKIPPTSARRASLTSGGPKAQRTSKTSQKLVVLPSAVQTKPLPPDADEDLILGHELGGVREFKSEAERMSKAQRKEAKFQRITAYCIAESFRMKLLASFLKREHNVAPRVFDEAMYVMYHLPLLPGYGPDTNIRSSAPGKPKSFLSRLSEAEENGYQGSYFNSPAPKSPRDGYISSSPINARDRRPSSPAPSAEQPTFYESDFPTPASEPEVALVSDFEPQSPSARAEAAPASNAVLSPTLQTGTPEDKVAEVVFFEYGVVVFFGLEEPQERDILEDIEKAQVLKRRIANDDWEVEEFHYTHDPHIAYPRIYNDFFTLKSRSHLLKLSISHALAQSTLLAHYETNAQRVLSSTLARSIPEQLAASGALRLRRHEALKLTGRLFGLRRDVNLVSNVLDVPELFWSEASMGELYDAVREYIEITGRVQVLNEKLGVASDFLDAIHDHLNNNEMTRITWIVIWLIVVAVLVELGEIIARLIVHATMRKEIVSLVIPKVDALRTLERMMLQS